MTLEKITFLTVADVVSTLGPNDEGVL